MTECPVLSAITEDTVVLTKENIGDLRPSVYERSPGTVVTVSCNGGYTLVGQEEFSCKASGQWSYSTKPYCTFTTATQTPPGGLDQDTKIMIGVVCAIAGLIVIALVIMIIAIYLRDRRRRRERLEFWGRIRDERAGPDYRRSELFGMWDDHRGRQYNRGRDGPPSTIDMEMYSRSPRPLPPPPPYEGRRNGGYSDYYDDIKQSRRSRSVDELSEQKPNVRDWVKRSSQLGRDDEYLDRSGVYGRRQRDSHIWRDSNF